MGIFNLISGFICRTYRDFFSLAAIYLPTIRYLTFDPASFCFSAMQKIIFRPCRILLLTKPRIIFQPCLDLFDNFFEPASIFFGHTSLFSRPCRDIFFGMPRFIFRPCLNFFLACCDLFFAHATIFFQAWRQFFSTLQQNLVFDHAAFFFHRSAILLPYRDIKILVHRVKNSTILLFFCRTFHDLLFDHTTTLF